jgi:hypothetical protein
MLQCRLLGHRLRFRAEGTTMTWACERGCGEGGSKEYESAAEASRYAAAFDRRDSDSVGSRPTVSTFPLWLARRLRQNRG